MTVRYVPEQYQDFTSALLACVSGDEIVLNTSTALLLPGLTSGLDNITVSAGPGKRPVLDHSILPDGGIGLTLGVATGWLFQGVTFRDRNGGSASLSCQGAMDIEDCVFEGCDFALRGNWAGTVKRTDFRHVLQYVATTSEDNVRFESCRFIACEVRALLLLEGEGSSVEHCTLIRCRSGSVDYEDGLDLIAADTVLACTAQDCQALDPESTRYIFHGASSVTRCNAWQCTVDDVAFASEGTLANNTTVDPLHVHPLLDLRLLPDSPLIGVVSSGTATLDRHGMTFFGTSSVGAHESVQIGVATVPALDRVLVGVGIGGAPEPALCLDRESWRIETSTGIQVAVASVTEIDQGEGLSLYLRMFELELHPTMSPWQTYTVRLSPGLYGYDEDTFVPEVAPIPYARRKYRNLAAVENAVGLQFKKLIGRPQVTLVRDFLPTDATMFVDSTLDIPSIGRLFGRDFLVSFTSRTDGALHGITTDLPRLVAIPAGAIFVLDERSVIPPA